MNFDILQSYAMSNTDIFKIIGKSTVIKYPDLANKKLYLNVLIVKTDVYYFLKQFQMVLVIGNVYSMFHLQEQYIFLIVMVLNKTERRNLLTKILL